MSGGLLVAGLVVPVPGVTVIGPHDAVWSHLSPGDCRPRTIVPHQIILHKTKGGVPELVRPGLGPRGRAERTADFWAGDPTHSGAQLVSGSDGVVGCLCDVVLTEAYHATVSNPYSIGIETYEEQGGIVYEAAIESTIAVVLTLVEHLGIQLQVPRTYNGRPLARMANGGRDVIGVLGHRDNTDRRGHWDPGDELFRRLRAHGAESFDFDAGEDKAVWKSRQLALNAKGYKLDVDGIPGPATTAALRHEGYRGGVWALGKTE